VDIFYVLGVTDVDDKIIKRAAAEKVSFLEVARTHEASFFADMETLNVKAPDSVTRVTEHMDEIIGFISQIELNGYSYVTDDGVYFDTLAFGDRYGKLAPPHSTRPPPEEADSVAEAIQSQVVKTSSNGYQPPLNTTQKKVSLPPSLSSVLQKQNFLVKRCVISCDPTQSVYFLSPPPHDLKRTTRILPSGSSHRGVKGILRTKTRRGVPPGEEAVRVGT
jgi:hypothetical protein